MARKRDNLHVLPLIPGFRHWRPRRFQVFGVGGQKTGTHSLAAMFEHRHRAAHEYDADRHIGIVLASLQGRASDAAVADWYEARDKQLWLEADISHLHGRFVHLLPTLFPEARFILTLREIRSWLDSVFNQSLGRRANPQWTALRAAIYGAPHREHPEAERRLQDRGLYPLQNYIHSWAERIENVVGHVPPERLLLLRTEHLADQSSTLARFCDIDATRLPARAPHVYAAAEKFDLLSQIDPDYLEAKIRERCSAILSKYFSD